MMAPARTLVVTPYLGEFGWELMNWQGRVRWCIRQGGHERVIICAPADRRRLYVDPADEPRVTFWPVSEFGLPGEASEDHRIDADGRRIDPTRLRQVALSATGPACAALGVDASRAEFLVPEFRSRMWPTTTAHQRFGELRVPARVSTDVLLVPRIRRVAGERNRPAAWWEALAAALRERGLRVEAYSGPLDRAIELVSRARIAVGASTGGLHLASLCRCPHYVWGCGREARWTRMGITNRQRYETVWNPLGTRCHYDECGWQPPVEHVVSQTLCWLGRIGLPMGRSGPVRGLRPAWRLRRTLAGMLVGEGAGRFWPWRVRRLVREYVV
jgi:hypothetical protein